MSSLPQIIALNKCDVYGAEENVKAFKKKYSRKYKIFPITAVNGEGTDKLIEGIFEVLEQLPPVKRIESAASRKTIPLSSATSNSTLSINFAKFPRGFARR